MNTEFLNTEILIFYLIVIISNLVIYLKSLFNLKIFIYYYLFCIISLLVSDNFFLVGMFISIVFAIYYFYIIPFMLKEERKEEIEKERLAKKIEFVVEKKEKVSNFLYNDYYLKSNKGIISVDKIDYYNFEKGDTLIIKEKELNKSATILDYRKVKK